MNQAGFRVRDNESNSGSRITQGVRSGSRMEDLLDGLKRRIDEAREAKGLTRAGLAKAIGAAPSTVSEWYTKGKMPTAGHVIRLVEALGVSPEWLLLGTGPRTRERDTTADPYRAGMVDLASAVIDALQGKLEENAPPGRRGEDGAIFREAANRLREIGAAEKVRRHEGSGSR